jgi:hypothetical protein
LWGRRFDRRQHERRTRVHGPHRRPRERLGGQDVDHRDDHDHVHDLHEHDRLLWLLRLVRLLGLIRVVWVWQLELGLEREFGRR